MKIAILGAGNMGGAIAKGLVRSGLSAADITLTRTQPEVPEDLAALGLAVTTDNTEAVAGAEVVFVAVKPWLVSTVLQPIAAKIPSGALVISVAAGVTLADLRADLSRAKGVRLARIMPNTAVGLCCGVTAIAGETPEARDAAKALLDRLGLTVVCGEDRFGAITALSGCGSGSSDGKTHLTFQIWDVAQRDGMQAVCDAYTEKNPNVEIEVQVTS